MNVKPPCKHLSKFEKISLSRSSFNLVNPGLGKFDSGQTRVAKQLQQAISSGDTFTVHRILQAHPPDNRPSVNFKSGLLPVLCLAASKGYADIVGLLIRHGAKINIASSDDSTPLIYAAENGHLAALLVLLNAGAAVNSANRLGETALVRATRRGWVQCARALILHGANPNPQPKDACAFPSTPLQLARQLHQDEIVQELTGRMQLLQDKMFEVVTATLPKYTQLLDPGHLNESSNLVNSLFPIQLVSEEELAERFTLCFKTPPSYNNVGNKRRGNNKRSAAPNRPWSTFKDESILIYIVRAQLLDNEFWCWLKGPQLQMTEMLFNGARKHGTKLQLAPSCLDYPGLTVYASHHGLKPNGWNTLNFHANPTNWSEVKQSEVFRGGRDRPMVLIGAYRIRIDVKGIIKCSAGSKKSEKTV